MLRCFVGRAVRVEWSTFPSSCTSCAANLFKRCYSSMSMGSTEPDLAPAMVQALAESWGTEMSAPLGP